MRTLLVFSAMSLSLLTDFSVCATPPFAVKSLARKKLSANPNLKSKAGLNAAGQKSHKATMDQVSKVRPAADLMVKLLPGYQKYVAVLKAREVTGVVVLNGVK